MTIIRSAEALARAIYVARQISYRQDEALRQWDCGEISAVERQAALVEARQALEILNTTPDPKETP